MSKAYIIKAYMTKTLKLLFFLDINPIKGVAIFISSLVKNFPT